MIAPLFFHNIIFSLKMDIKQAQAKAISENPFYGLREALRLNKYYEKVTDENTNATELNSALSATWLEALQASQKAPEGEKDKFFELFFSIVFAGGDIQNREHNMFDKIKVDQGGQAKRKAFRLSLDWILKYQPAYFYKFLPIIAEYTNYENLWYNQIRTDRRKGTLLSTERLQVDHQKIAEHLQQVLTNVSTTDFEKGCIAKFLPKVPQSKRWRKDKDGKSLPRGKKAHTLSKDAVNIQLIKELSNVMGWEVVTYPNMTRYKGYEQFRSQYLASTEAHLFSSKKITLMDDLQFQTWLEGLPAGARYRVQTRLLKKEGTTLTSKEKWKTSNDKDMGVVYQDWMLNKEIAMTKLVSLSEEDKKDMDKTELKTLTKQAKVTTGGDTIYTSFLELFSSQNGCMLNGDGTVSTETNVKLQTLLDKVKLDVPLMVCIDVSGSMSGTLRVSGERVISRMDVAKLIAAIALYKNPNTDLANTIISFDTHAEVYSDGLKAPFSVPRGSNSYMGRDHIRKDVGIICDRKKPFTDTLKNVNAIFQPGGITNFSSVADELKRWVEEDPQDKNRRTEIICSYPVWLMVSDGALNSAGTPGGSMDQFKSKMLNYFGASPVIVVWDILNEGYEYGSQFENIDNVVHLAGCNPAIINQLFCNLSNLDVIDVYTQLVTLHRSSRYAPVRYLTTAEEGSTVPTAILEVEQA